MKIKAISTVLLMATTSRTMPLIERLMNAVAIAKLFKLFQVVVLRTRPTKLAVAAFMVGQLAPAAARFNRRRCNTAEITAAAHAWLELGRVSRLSCKSI